MPVKRCQSDNKEGRKWGDEGKCYPCSKTDDGWDCKGATQKALAQARAMGELEDVDESDEKLAEIVERNLRDNENFNRFWKGELSGRRKEVEEIQYKGVTLYVRE